MRGRSCDLELTSMPGIGAWSRKAPWPRLTVAVGRAPDTRGRVSVSFPTCAWGDAYASLREYTKVDG